MSDAPPLVDLELRLVRYFTVVADHRHFGRAAAELRVAQPSLSRQIRSLEQRLGVRLLDRTPQGTRLTEAGEAFLPRAKALLRSAAQAAASARAAAQPSRITIGYEPRELLIPRGHRLAGKESVTLDDIAGEPMPRLSDPAWNAYWRIDPRPDGSPAPDGPLVNDVEDKLELIAAGQAVSIVSAGLRAGVLRPDLTTVPLRGVEPVHVVLATRADDRGRLVTAFRKYARAHLTASQPT